MRSLTLACWAEIAHPQAAGLALYEGPKKKGAFGAAPAAGFLFSFFKINETTCQQNMMFCTQSDIFVKNKFFGAVAACFRPRTALFSPIRVGEIGLR